jgi:hypothetical protein
MRHRPLQYLRDLPRGPGGSHRRAATERSFSSEKLLQLAKDSFPSLWIFRPTALFNWLKNYSKRALGPNAAFPKPTQADVHELLGTSIAIAGDWGTGTWEASQIAALMEKEACDYTIHLGDVYYVGDGPSIKENCEGKDQGRYTPVKWAYGKKRTFAMNGNHEAYARDGAYFDWIQKSFGQSSSCFALYNEHWIVLGLDTGYNSEGIPWLGWLAEHFGWRWFMPSCKLPPDCIDWLRETVKPLFSQRAIVLLSHHQYFSSFDNEYPNAARQLASIQNFADRPVLWLWGHEHRFAAYGMFGEEGITAYGRCLGHGGMPVDRGHAPKRSRPLEFYDDRSYDPELGEIVEKPKDFGVNGFAVLRFEGPNLEVSYRDIAGSNIITEQWLAKGGSAFSNGSPKFGGTVKLMPDGRITVANSTKNLEGGNRLGHSGEADLKRGS